MYIAAIDVGWYGRDTTKRFDVDSTPTMLLLCNEGYDGKSNNDFRFYYIYCGQRSIYPLRNLVLGGYATRKGMNMAPSLS